MNARPARVDRSLAERLATECCGWDDASGDLTELDTGFGNHNWRVRVDDDHVLLKIGPAASAPKWAAAQVGADRAREAGAPVPRLRSVQVIGDQVVRVLDWIDGEPARTLVGDVGAQRRLGAELGAMVAAVHERSLDVFGSRLDGTDRSFVRWAEYVHHRLDQIETRAKQASAPGDALRRRAHEAARRLAEEVDPRCRPVVCHRDLHADNLIVGQTGSLLGVIDWDMAEAWDPAGEWFKLDRLLFELLPAARRSFEVAYASRAPDVDEERRRLVLLVESLNVVANAGKHADDFVDFGLAQLEALTDERP